MGRKASAKMDVAEVIDQWMDRDLTADARNNLLLPAYEMDELVAKITEILALGRYPVLVGDRGVGKTAIVHQLVRQSVQPDSLSPLAGKQVLQFSLQRRAAGLKKADELRPEAQKLMEALSQVGDAVVPYFCDFHMVYQFDIEELFTATRLPVMAIAEGELTTCMQLFEYHPRFEERFLLMTIEEPSPEQVGRILRQWASDHHKRTGMQFREEALDEAVHLTHRFLSRSRLPRKAIDLLNQVASVVGQKEEIHEPEVVARFCRSHRVPAMLVDPSIALDLQALEQKFGREVLGQQESVKSIVQMIGVIKAGLTDVRRPFGAFLYVGPTGVGKTHVAQLLAEHLFGSRERMLRFNMADFQQEHDQLTLFGDPNGHTPHGRRGIFTQRLMGHPFAVVLLDEFEKAHTKIHDRFLQLFDEGSFINGAGELVSCRSMILIATSNAGAEIYRNQAVGFSPMIDPVSIDREVARKVSQHFRFEFLNRFDQVVHFRPLNREHIRQIALRELEALGERTGIKRRGVTLEIDEAVLDWLAIHGYDPYHGARFLRRTIERNVTTAIAEILVRQTAETSLRIGLYVLGNRIAAKLVEFRPDAIQTKVQLPRGTATHSKKMDRAALEQLAHDILTQSEPRLKDLEQQREAAAALLSQMNQPGMWENPAESRELLAKYRDLDVLIQLLSRYAAKIDRLRELLQDSKRSAAWLQALARAGEEAADALKSWEEALNGGGNSAIWVVLSRVDPLQVVGDWLSDLVEMERAWCKKLGASARVVAYEMNDQAPVRVILDVDGPAIAKKLAMEQGIHRLARAKQADLKVHIEMLEQSKRAPTMTPKMSQTRQQAGLFGLDVKWQGRLEFDLRGSIIDFLGSDRDVMAHALADLSLVWQVPRSSGVSMARVYGQEGTGARDPRTSISVPRMKDVLRGDLDRFYEGWRQRERQLEQKEAHLLPDGA